MPIEWNENLKTGVQIIDEQHKYLIVMLARLGRLRTGRENFQDAYNELKEFMLMHFKVEEDYMISSKYPNYSKHKRSHDRMWEGLKPCEERILSDEDIISLGADVYDYVMSWFIAHYSAEDIYLAKYIKSHPNNSLD